MRLLASEGYLGFLQFRGRARRRLRGEADAVDYFHQVDDPYSHLAVQKLDRLRDAYRIPFRVHLVSQPEAAFQGSAEHFTTWAVRDAESIADDYGTMFRPTHTPTPDEVRTANDLLAPTLQGSEFAPRALAVGEALWGGTLAARNASDAAGQAAVQSGNARRQHLGHYLGGMFHLDGEWFWGVDRLRHLEARLIARGCGGGPVIVPEPTPPDTRGLNASGVTLEYFPSLRSPYTAVGHPRVLELIARSGVTVRLRPVMPMMMRGIPAPTAKQRYIITDAAREARARGVPFGRFVDPFGEPVRRAFALLPAAERQGRGMEFVTSYLRAAWAEGVDIASEAGLAEVAVRAGVHLPDADSPANEDWEAPLTANLNDMLAAGLWGVPSFRVSGGSDPEPFACWGQDRIWRVESEIARRTT